MNTRQYLAPPSRIKKSTAMGQTTSSEPVFFIEPKFPIYTTTKGIVNHTAFGPLFFDYECDGCGGSYSCPHYYFKEENRTWILHAVLPKGSNTIFYCHGDEKFQAVLNAYATALEGVSFAITFEEDHVAGQKLFCETVKKHRNIHELVLCSGEISSDGELSKAIHSMPSLIRVDCRIQNFTEQDLQLLPAILNNNHVEKFSMHGMPQPPSLWSPFCSAWKNTQVQELSLNCVPEPALLWNSFCSALASNTSLKKITFTPSNKTDLSPIATILESGNKTLKELNVMMIHPNGCEAVLKSMKSNTMLETLSIALNVESDYELFKEMIKVNKTLKNLTVSCYHWQCMDIFWEGIGQNNGLVTLNLKYIYDIKNTMGKLCVAALKNVGIKKLLVNDAAVTIKELRKEFAQYKMNIAIISRHVYMPTEIWTQIIKSMNVLSALNEDLMVRTIKYTKANFGLQVKK